MVALVSKGGASGDHETVANARKVAVGLGEIFLIWIAR
jgi:hypothetical protein